MKGRTAAGIRFRSGFAILWGFALAACFACTAKEPAIPDAPPPPSAAPSHGSPTPLPAAGTARDSGPNATEGRIAVSIVPPNPSRLFPPRIEVVPAGGPGDRIVQVLWTVEGRVVAEGERLSPGMFRKGERIGATATVKTGERELTLKAPEVTAVGSPPSVTEIRIEPPEMRTGDTVRAVAKGESPDGNDVTFRFRWFVDDVPLPGDGPEMVLEGVRKGAWVHAMAVPNDGIRDGGGRYSPKYKVLAAPPAVKVQGEPNLSPEGVLSCVIAASDPDGDPLSVELVAGPPGMTLTGNVLSWKVPEGGLGRPVEAVVRVPDGDGGYVTRTLTVSTGIR